MPHRAKYSTPTLINEAYSQLLSAAMGYKAACILTEDPVVIRMFNSFAARLDQMAGHLKDNGAKKKAVQYSNLAILFESESNQAPRDLLTTASTVQSELIKTYTYLQGRLDMDKDLFNLLIDQNEELVEVKADIEDLQRNIEAFDLR